MAATGKDRSASRRVVTPDGHASARATVTARGLLMSLEVARLLFAVVHAVSVQQRETT
jgi:hypothetical protein